MNTHIISNYINWNYIYIFSYIQLFLLSYFTRHFVQILNLAYKEVFTSELFNYYFESNCNYNYNYLKKKADTITMTIT